MFPRHAYRVAACALAVAAAAIFLPTGVRAAPDPPASPDALTTVTALDDHFYPADVTVAAGTILIREAGGVVSDWDGGADVLGGSILAGAPPIHAELLALAAR